MKRRQRSRIPGSRRSKARRTRPSENQVEGKRKPAGNVHHHFYSEFVFDPQVLVPADEAFGELPSDYESVEEDILSEQSDATAGITPGSDEAIATGNH